MYLHIISGILLTHGGLGTGVGLCAHTCVNKTVVTVYIEKSHLNINAIMTILLSNIQFNHDDTIPSHTDIKGFLFKAMEDPVRRKMMLKGYFENQNVTPRGPDQASICDELGVRVCVPQGHQFKTPRSTWPSSHPIYIFILFQLIPNLPNNKLLICIFGYGVVLARESRYNMIMMSMLKCSIFQLQVLSFWNLIV